MMAILDLSLKPVGLKKKKKNPICLSAEVEGVLNSSLRSQTREEVRCRKTGTPVDGGLDRISATP